MYFAERTRVRDVHWSLQRSVVQKAEKKQKEKSSELSNAKTAWIKEVDESLEEAKRTIAIRS